jgi:Pectinacetylesterase
MEKQRSVASSVALCLLALVVASIALAACGGSTTTGTGATEAGWKRVFPGGRCRCSDGSRFSYWLHEASRRKVVFYLQDGGACFDAKTCAPSTGVYQTRVTEGPAGETGAFEFGNPRNPLASYSAVYVPYCSGDVHLGETTVSYGRGLTVHHDGFVNGTTAMKAVLRDFPDATDVVVIGESAGSLSAPVYAALIADRLPDARVTSISDGSGSYPDDPRIDKIIASWGVARSLPSWTGQSGDPNGRWSFPGLFIQSHRHAPRVVFARHDYAFDQGQAMWYPLVGVPTRNLLVRTDANGKRIRAAGVDLHSYIAPGDDHTAMTEDEFYTEKVGGESLRDWVARLVAGKPVADVHCRDCRNAPHAIVPDRILREKPPSAGR